MKYKNTANLVRIRREKKGVSQSEISRKLKYAHSQFISNFERGYSPLPIKKLNDIRKILGISKAELLKALHQDFVAHIKKDIR